MQIKNIILNKKYQKIIIDKKNLYSSVCVFGKFYVHLQNAEI